ncbi:MAG TPA: siderophore-interacting protein [Dehalococcoidia bacterium]|nr:siderophore-interacting protein [Dehalococcoidia bacterium]
MNQTEQQPVRRRRMPQYHQVQVRRVERMTPHLVRVTLHGEDLAKFETHGVAEHLKVMFPAPGQERPVLPAWTEDGPVYAEGVARPVMRTYTPRSWRPEALELDLEFLVHGEGVGSTWAAKADVGDHLVVTLPGGPYRLDPEVTNFVIAGDESALPAIETILESLAPSARAEVFIEVESSSDELELNSPAHVDLHWLHRGAGAPVAGRKIEAAMREVALPEGGRIFVACEAGVMRDIRKHLMLERGLDRTSFHTQGYWKLGASNHPDHDLGDD